MFETYLSRRITVRLFVSSDAETKIHIAGSRTLSSKKNKQKTPHQDLLQQNRQEM